MTREQYINKAERLRKGKTVATIKQKEGRRYVVTSKEYDSLNLAKKATGLGAVELVNGEALPMTEAELDAMLKKAA